jgi:hypothetical protein
MLRFSFNFCFKCILFVHCRYKFLNLLNCHFKYLHFVNCRNKYLDFVYCPPLQMVVGQPEMSIWHNINLRVLPVIDFQMMGLRPGMAKKCGQGASRLQFIFFCGGPHTKSAPDLYIDCT